MSFKSCFASTQIIPKRRLVVNSSVDGLCTEIHDLFTSITQKIAKLSEALNKTSNYWESVDKYLKRGNLKGEVSTVAQMFQEFKTTLLSFSSTLSKPADLFKGAILHVSTQNRKNLDSVTDVSMVFMQMLLTRSHLNKSYLEDLKKATGAASQKGELDPAQIKKLAKQTVGGI